MNIVVGVSDMKVSNDPDSVLVTYSLGSCIGVSIYDQVARVGGLLHFMLPESSLDPKKAEKNPFMFADTGIPALFKAAYALGGAKQRMKVVVVGGAQVLDQQGFFNIGKRNHMAVRKIFWKNSVMVNFEDVGGNNNRTIRLMIRDGKTLLKVSGEGEREI
ncbi:MAG: chemotaxis protein CheD [Deltaproteobacteria bacterium]|nr:chemotaxis protein CheD [Deltaproteobacteria bacterium]